MNKKRITAFVLAALLAATALLCACTGGTDGPGTDTVPSGRISENDRLAADDGLGDIKFTGKKYRVSCTDLCQFEIFSDDRTDVCGAAVYNRNIKIEDRFGIEIVPVITAMAAAGGGQGQLYHEQYISQVLGAGDDEFDTVMMQVWRAGTLIVDGYFGDWNNGVPGVNVSQPWWSQLVNDMFTFDGALYAAVGDISLTALQQTYAYMLNKDLANDYKIPDLYEVVRNGEWTLEYVNSLVKDIYSDENANSEVDEGDIFGFATGTVHDASAYLYAFGLSLTGKDRSGALNVVLDTSKAEDVYEKVYKLFYETPGSFTYETDKEYSKLIGLFTSGHALLSPQPLSRLYDNMRSMEQPYGVLPYPKYDAAQDKYYSGMSNNWSVICYPSEASDIELTGCVTEALCCENYRTVITAYYDKALKDKYTDTDDDEEMLDLILDGKRGDLVLLYGPNLSGMNALFRYQLQKKAASFIREWDANELSYVSGLYKIEMAYDRMALERQG